MLTWAATLSPARSSAAASSRSACPERQLWETRVLPPQQQQLTAFLQQLQPQTPRCVGRRPLCAQAKRVWRVCTLMALGWCG